MNQVPIKPLEATWNDEQWEAIYRKGEDLLISAGAGSGKTAVLVERMIQKIIQEKLNIDELLVMTFTEAAAAEMKQRMRSRIQDELEKQPDNEHLKVQLNKISQSHISTFHAFCNKLIKRYYYFLCLRLPMILKSGLFKMRWLNRYLMTYQMMRMSLICC